MTKETLKKACDICEQIDRLNQDLSIWERAIAVRDFTLETPEFSSCSVSLSTLDFETLRTNAVANLKSKLEKLNAEFEEL